MLSYITKAYPPFASWKRWAGSQSPHLPPRTHRTQAAQPIIPPLSTSLHLAHVPVRIPGTGSHLPLLSFRSPTTEGCHISCRDIWHKKSQCVHNVNQTQRHTVSLCFLPPILCCFYVTSPIMAASQWNAACILVIYASLCHPEFSSCSRFMRKHPDSLLSPNLWYLLHTCNLNFQCGSRDVSSQSIQPLSACTETEILQVVDVPSV